MSKRHKQAQRVPTPITIDIDGVIVTPVQSATMEEVCTKCFFSFEGRSQRNCPKLQYGRFDSKRNLCIMLQIDGKPTTYFEEVK